MIRGILGTAGHIDHGKTALVAALTGIETDRLPEEKRRGITIDLGFSHLDLGHATLGVVDVPGHEDFIRNMVAGATGIDLLLLVVAADEGVMPQTREHVAIARLLGVPRAVVALTKRDLVDDDWLELAMDDVATFLHGTPFAAAPVVPTSVVSGAGLAELRAAIDAAVAPARGRPDDLFRMPIDRAFSVRGTGTVVTGTVWSGQLERDARVRLLPGDLVARVRTLQVHGEAADSIEPGQRAAIALTGTDRADVARGMTLVADDAWQATARMTVRLHALHGPGWSVEAGQRLRVHLGTAEVMARALILDQDRIEPGAAGWAQLRLESPLVARAGDRFVVRSYSPVETIGGGTVVEPFPPRRRRRSLTPETIQAFQAVAHEDPQAAVVAVVRQAGGAGVEIAALPLLAGATAPQVERTLQETSAVIAGGFAFAEDAGEGVESALLDAVDAYHQAYPLRPGIDAAELRRAAPRRTHEALVAHTLDHLLGDSVLVMRQGRVARPGHQAALSPDQERTVARIREAFATAGAQPPRVEELRDALHAPADFDDLLALLEARGALVRLDQDLLMDSVELDRIAQAVKARFGGRQDVSPSEFRDVVPASRKHLIPILEHLDQTGITTRGGDGRIVSV